jgi:ABC-2 type transport system ATP-binding protein
MIEVRNLTSGLAISWRPRCIPSTSRAARSSGSSAAGAGRRRQCGPHRLHAGTSGTATVDGFDVFESSFEVRRRIGYLPETPPLYTDMTVESYLQFVARIKAVPRSDIADAVARVSATCGLTDVRERLTGHLSKGYRQRVGLAQALIHDPPVLVLDEPTIGLDPRQIIEIRKLIRELAGNRTVILSTHILPEVSQICEKVVILAAGRIALEERMENLLKQGLSLEEIFFAIFKEKAGG